MDIEKISRHLQDRLPNVRSIYLFGSYASDEFESGSDLDVAVLLAKRSDPVVLWRLAGELADIAGVPVDLVDMGMASTVLQYQILTKGRRLWAKDSCVGVFEAFVLSEKTALDTARADLLDDVQHGGVVHGR